MRWFYTSTLTVQGVVFRFECVNCYDPAREVHTIKMLEIEPVDWTARLAVV